MLIFYEEARERGTFELIIFSLPFYTLYVYVEICETYCAKRVLIIWHFSHTFSVRIDNDSKTMSQLFCLGDSGTTFHRAEPEHVMFQRILTAGRVQKLPVFGNTPVRVSYGGKWN